jgi:hypothetical protein
MFSLEDKDSNKASNKITPKDLEGFIVVESKLVY